MTDKTREILIQAGIDLDSAKDRMMGNEKLLLRMLFKIDNEKNRTDLTEAFESKDTDKAFHVAHTLKGMFGNLSVLPLYDVFSRQTELLRAGAFSLAEEMLPEIKEKLDLLQEALLQAKLVEENG